MRVNFKMAGPHGDRRRNLNTGFTEFATPEAFQDAQVGSPKSHTLEFDAAALGSSSGTFHSSLEPSILSIFEDSSAEEAKIHIDEESEASLLSAFSEMLDSVIEDTLSPFDTLPDSKLFMGQRCQDSRVRSHCLDREAAPRVTRSFTPPNSKVGCELEEKERFWSELDEVIVSIPTGERVVIGADFNGHVGEGNTGDEEVMGKFGVKERNLEGQMVVDFAKRMDMGVVTTYFQKREEHRVTYKSGGRKVLGVSSGRRKEDKETWWWNGEVKDSIQRKSLAKKKWDMDRTEENRQEYKELQRRVKREVSKAKQKAYEELYTRLDTREGEKDLYRLARQRDRDGKDVQQVIKDRDGRVLTSEESVQRRWKEYFEELMNEENERGKRLEGVNSVEQKVDKIRKDEVRKALKRMKSGKAVGPDDIPVEVWKCLGEAAVEFLTSLFNRVLENLEKAYDRVPREELWYCMWKSGVAEKYVRVVQDMYERSRTVVMCAVGQTEKFKVEVGLHQGSALSPFLFAIVMDQLSEEVRQESPWTMMFADDIVICNESREQVEENLERWRFALERRGMKVSRSKTEYMCVNEREGSGTVRLQGEEVKKVQDSGEPGHAVWFRDSVTEEETVVEAETLHSDRQLRPRLHRRTHTATIQRSDGEEEDLRETRRRPMRIFRIESDPNMCEDEQQDGFLSVSLVELVRHMHPYSLRVARDKKECLRDIEDLPDDDVFVDVVGDDDTEETTLGMSVVRNPSDMGSEQIVPNPQSPAASSAVCNSSQEDMMCSPTCEEQKEEDDDAKSVFAKAGSSRKIKKKVRFASALASIHIYQVENEADEGDFPDASFLAEHTNDLKMADGDSQTTDLNGNSAEIAKKTPSQHGDTKLKTLSLQEYRLLRQNTLPKEERKTDYRTKWPSVPETPKELPPISCIPGYNSSQVNVQPPSSNTKTSTRGAVAKSRRNLRLPLKSLLKQNVLVRKPVQAVDPPNPVTLSLHPDAKILPHLSKEQEIMQQETGKSQVNRTNLNPPEAVQPNSVTQEQPLMVSPENSSANCSLMMSGIVKTNVSAPISPVTEIATSHSAKEKKQGFAGEIGIEATDVTSLLEQFETQGLTPPATPPHQIWNPLTPTLKARQNEATKPSPSKTIQIIEPMPLPPSKIQSKPQPSLSIPAPSLFLAFIDHDYCGTQDFRLSKKRALSDVYMHNRSPKESRNHMSHIPMDNRTSCEAERLSGSVLLSPESSPCRLETRRTREHTEAETRRRSHCSCSQSPPARGRTMTRHYRKRYRDSDSSSVSSSRSPSCSSSASSCSPPRKRYRSRHSESSSSSSSRSSSWSLSPSPNRGRRCCYRRSQSRSFSRSRSRSPQPDWRQKWSSWRRQREYYHLSRGEDTYKAKQKAIEERRVVYVGRIHGTMTKDELRERFALFGKIEDCTVHFRSHGDNFGFVTYYNTDDAFAAIEKGTKLRQPDELPFDICFGGRRQFCQSNYMDLDSNYDMDPAPRRSE
ncbi:hypothetical protein QTP86_030147, partial [Hemibagrus guttatus]